MIVLWGRCMIWRLQLLGGLDWRSYIWTKSFHNDILLFEQFLGCKIDTCTDLETKSMILMSFVWILQTMRRIFLINILLNSLLESYHEVKKAIKHSRDDLPLDFVINALKSRKLELKHEPKDMGEGLVTKGRSTNSNQNWNLKWKQRQKLLLLSQRRAFH